MKKILFSLAAAFVTAGAFAAPVPTLPAGPIYLEYTGQEQIAINGAYTYSENGVKEINWGVFSVTAMTVGKVTKANDLISKKPKTGAFFSDVLSGGQITGMFYGIEAGQTSPGSAFSATRGYLDLYWRDNNVFHPENQSDAEPTPAIRCGFDCATGYTEGEFLARLYFDTGMDAFSSTNTIVGSQAPTSNSAFAGLASAYMSVDMSKVGVWSETLNGNWFKAGSDQRDLRFNNVYVTDTSWNGTNPNILGAQLSAGSGQAYALPEPGALSLMGLAMIGMGAALRRRG
jgi:hypothetical protein